MVSAASNPCECCCQAADELNRARLCSTCADEEAALQQALRNAPRRGRNLTQWRTQRKVGKVTVRYADGTSEVKPGRGFAPEPFDYPTYLRSHTWRQLRAEVLERDLHRCTWCRSTDRLHVHHLTYERIGNEALGDLTTLCNECHRRAHGKAVAA